ncbi:hypothetical protein TNCV_5134421 [Trichonephila clavipes]|nr:hypothetical protein TNCV_5134421 [Trichonephila clavipes]
MTAVRFRDEVLESYVHSFRGTVVPDFMTTMHNNARPHIAYLVDEFLEKLNNRDDKELWFQQDGATCHTARATIDLLKDTFGDRLISRFGPVNWPPRSCDFNTARLFSVGLCKVIGLCG